MMGIKDIFGSDNDIDFDQNPIQESINSDIKESTEEINSRIQTINRWTSLDEVEELEPIPDFQDVLDKDQEIKELYIKVAEGDENEYSRDRRNLAFKLMNARQETQNIIDVYTSFLATSEAEMEFKFHSYNWEVDSE